MTEVMMRNHCYSIPSRNGVGWSVTFLEQHLRIISIVSDYGTYSYVWGNRESGKDFRVQLLEFGADYVRGKLGGSHLWMENCWPETRDLIQAELDEESKQLAPTNDACWHCLVLLEGPPILPRCDRCPEECDDPDCKEPGCEERIREEEDS